jgi:hypothetical protein
MARFVLEIKGAGLGVGNEAARSCAARIGRGKREAIGADRIGSLARAWSAGFRRGNGPCNMALAMSRNCF